MTIPTSARPKGGHAQEALLGLAISLTAINEKRAACDTLTKLHTEFPTPAARAARPDQRCLPTGGL